MALFNFNLKSEIGVYFLLGHPVGPGLTAKVLDKNVKKKSPSIPSTFVTQTPENLAAEVLPRMHH